MDGYLDIRNKIHKTVIRLSQGEISHAQSIALFQSIKDDWQFKQLSMRQRSQLVCYIDGAFAALAGAGII